MSRIRLHALRAPQIEANMKNVLRYLLTLNFPQSWPSWATWEFKCIASPAWVITFQAMSAENLSES